MWEDLPNGFYADQEFQDYAQSILTIIKQGNGVSIADIHRSLGDKAVRKWTMAAIDTLEYITAYQSGALTRYKYHEARKAHELHTPMILLDKRKNLTPFGAFKYPTGF